MRGPLLFLLAGLLLPVVLSSASAQDPPPAPSEEGVMLHMLEYAYAPDPLEVPAGSEVITMNFGPRDQSLPRDQWVEFTHSVTAVDGSFDLQNIPPDFAARPFTAPQKAGTYPYYCRYHGDATSGMRGTLVVAAADPTPEATPEIGDKETPAGVLPLLFAFVGGAWLVHARR